MDSLTWLADPFCTGRIWKISRVVEFNAVGNQDTGSEPGPYVFGRSWDGGGKVSGTHFFARRLRYT